MKTDAEVMDPYEGLSRAMSCEEFLSHSRANPWSVHVSLTDRTERLLRSMDWSDLKLTGIEWNVMLSFARSFEDRAERPSVAPSPEAHSDEPEESATPEPERPSRRDDWPSPRNKAGLTARSLTPELITAVLAEYNYVADDDMLDDYWLARVFDNRGLAIAAANATRRAVERTGSVWPIIESVERFLSPHVDKARAAEARCLIADARAGRLAQPTFDDGCDFERSLELEASPLARCFAMNERTAWEVGSVDSDNCDHDCDYATTYDCFQLVHVLATEVSESAARELIAVIEAIGTQEAATP